MVEITYKPIEVEWTNNLIKSLIDEFKKKPMLWDMSHAQHSAQCARYEAYSELANTFGCTILDLRRKLNSVFASYRREKVKVRNNRRSNWFLYSHLEFLPNHVPNLPLEKTSLRTEESDYEEEHLDEDLIETYEPIHEEITIKEEGVQDAVKVRRSRHLPHKPVIVKKPISRQVVSSQLDHRLLEAVKLLRRSEHARKKDECDSFGEYIATSLRKHDERTQSMIKQAINNILFEQEMKKFNTTQYVVMPGMDENPLTLSDNENSEK